MAIFVYITCESKAVARVIAKTLVEEQLVAGANIFPIESIYWWDNEIQENEEYVIIGKTTILNFEMLKARVKQLHNYEVPCIVSLPILDGNDDYLSWIIENTKKI